MEKIKKSDLDEHIMYCSREFARILNTHKLSKKEKKLDKPAMMTACAACLCG
jgi:hypothetical protein